MAGTIEVYTGDLRELVVEKWSVLTPDTPVYVYCPKHEDSLRKSMRVYPNGAYCFTCRARLNRAEFSALFSGPERTAAKLLAGTLERKRCFRPKVNIPAVVQAGCSLLLTNPYKREWLHRRGLTDETIEYYQLGHYGTAYTIPVYNSIGEVKTVRFRRDDEEAPEAPKYWGIKGESGTLVYPGIQFVGRIAVMTEGEFDALLLRQEGLPAFSLTNGCRAGERLKDWAWVLAHTERLIMCRDQDIAGQDATESLCELLAQQYPQLDMLVVGWEGHEKDVSELWQRSPERYTDVIDLVRQLTEESYAATA